MEQNSVQMSHLSVAIVVYNSSLEWLGRTLDSLYRSCEPLLGQAVDKLSVLLVNNGSDRSYGMELEALVRAKAWPGLTLVQLESNGGFGSGQNQALAAGVGDYHLVLNPDVELAPDALGRALAIMEADTGIALLSPGAVGTDGHQEFLCKRYPSVAVLALRAFAPGFGRRCFPAMMRRYDMSDVCALGEPVDIPLASGCFMFIRGQNFAEVRGFNEDFFLYFEDFDLSLRLAKLGRLSFEPSVKIVHHGGYAASKGWRHLRMFVRSGWQFFNRHGWRWI